MLKRWCSIKEIEVYLLCEILISKDTLQGQKTVASLLKLLFSFYLVFSVVLGMITFLSSKHPSAIKNVKLCKTIHIPRPLLDFFLCWSLRTKRSSYVKDPLALTVMHCALFIFIGPDMGGDLQSREEKLQPLMRGRNEH